MLSIIPSETPIPLLHQYLLGAVGPRPICFASTIDAAGNHNLAPFSFFNVFSAKPPIAIFSPNLSGRTGQAKDTHLNIKEVPECVINIVDYTMVHQMSLASSPYPKGTSEFIKAGFTPIPSDLVKPVLDDKKLIDQQKIDLVARMGGNWYCRAHGDALFEIEKPITTIGIGIDVIPERIKHSSILTGNNLGQLGNIEILPNEEEINTFNQTLSQKINTENEKHAFAKTLLELHKVKEAWCVLLG